MCMGPPEAAGTLRLRAVLEARGPTAALVLSDEQVGVLGGERRTPPVRVTVNGHTFRGRIGRRGSEALVGFNKEQRAACRVEPGDTIDVELALDDEPRAVELPEALAAALADDTTAKLAFDALSYTRRKELARGIAEAKRPETRERRLADLLARLHER
jgi:Bacteriocin-protection, YdeI or OmpD-Associated/Domain of unknown function (DUF1905)